MHEFYIDQSLSQNKMYIAPCVASESEAHEQISGMHAVTVVLPLGG